MLNSALKSYNIAALRDSLASKQTEESMKVLNEQIKEDSQEMRVLAFIGIVFLPTTLVATMVSAAYEDGRAGSAIWKVVGIILSISLPITLVFYLVARPPSLDKYWVKLRSRHHREDESQPTA